MRMMLCLALVALGGCATSIIPPQDPTDPVTVYVADYGRHATLILPRESGSAEYGYGHWRWFAEGDAWLAKGPLVLLIPGKATLARREIEPGADLQTELGAASVTPMEVNRTDAAILLSKLDTRFEAGRDRLHHNPENGLDFVPDPTPYWLGNSCNTVLADWLRELGCSIRGPAITSDFRFLPPGASGDEAQPPARPRPAAASPPG